MSKNTVNMALTLDLTCCAVCGQGVADVCHWDDIFFDSGSLSIQCLDGPHLLVQGLIVK